MTDCYREKLDWRACTKEVREAFSCVSDMALVTCQRQHLPKSGLLLILFFRLQIEMFKKCWKQQGNDKRTETKDA